MFSVCPAESEEGGSPENVALFNFRRATTDDDDRHTSMCEKGAICVGMRIKEETLRWSYRPTLQQKDHQGVAVGG